MGKYSIFGARKTFAAITTAAMLIAGMTLIGGSTASADVAPTPPPLLQRDTGVVTSDPIPTVQIDNGYVWSQTMIGSTVYAVGKFDNAREPLAAPGTSLTARSNVLAYDINSGALLPFAPQVNGVIKSVAASPDGTRIYIGGSFSSVNGKARWNLAALDAATGQLVPGFAPSIGGTGVYAISVSGSNVYVGGLFTQANGTARKNLAAFTSTKGALLDWAPTTDRQIDAMVMDPAGTNVIVGGRFAQINGTTLSGSAAVDKTTGVLDTAWALSKSVKNGSSTGTNAGKAGVFALATDTGAVDGTGWVHSSSAGNLEGSFAAEAGTGKVRWIADCHGDHYGVYSTGKVVYTTNHTYSCTTINLHSLQPVASPQGVYRYAEAYTADARGTLGTDSSWKGTGAPSPYAWTPDWTVGTKTGLGQAGLSITGTGNMISIGGEFGSVNNKQFEGLVRFSTTPPGGAKDGPRVSGASWVPTAQSTIPGQVDVTISSNWDRDDLTLTYELLRTGRSSPVASITGNATFWNRPSITLSDKSAGSAAQQEYTVVAKDGNGNTVSSQAVKTTVMAGGPSDPAAAVLAADEFNRTAGPGWGSADAGAAWTVAGGSQAAATLTGSQGALSLIPGDSRNATLNSTSILDSLSSLQFTVDQPPTAGGAYVGVTARNSAAGKYLVRAWLRPDGSMWLVAHRDGTVLATQAVAGMTFAANTSYTLKVSVVGSTSAAIKAKLWATGTTEPANWQLSATDAASLGAGSAGVTANRSASATAAIGVLIDSFRVTAPE